MADQHTHAHDHSGHSHQHQDHYGHDHHDHDHHGHSHHAPSTFGNAFLISIALNTAFVVAEATYGFIANSTALLADAGHNASDVLGLLLAWAATTLSRRAPRGRFTYGLRSSSILAALTNAVLLLLASGAIALEALQRISAPTPVAGLTVTVVAAVGIVINGASAILLMKGSKDDLNVRSAYMHMVADTAISFGVVVAGLVIMRTGWNWLDPVSSLVIVAIIVAGTWGLLRESLNLALNAAPNRIDINEVENYLRQCEGVTDMHDLHIWGMSTTESALTVHLIIPEGYRGDAYMDEITQTLKTRFNITHSTLQIEQGTIQHACALHDTPSPA